MIKNKEFTTTLCTMMLFLIFAVCSLMLVIIGADTYKRILNNLNNNFNSSSAINYINNKIRAYDGNHIEIYEKEGVSILSLSEGDKGSKYETIIYYYNGGIYEALKSKSTIFKPNIGEKIFDASDMKFEFFNQKTLTVKVIDKDNTELKSYVNIKNHN